MIILLSVLVLCEIFFLHNPPTFPCISFYVTFFKTPVLAAAPDILPQLIPHVFHMYINISIPFFIVVSPIVLSFLLYRHIPNYLQDFHTIPKSFPTSFYPLYVALLFSYCVVFSDFQ